MKDDISTTRLIIAIFSTLVEEAALVVIVRLGLPQIDINIPLPGLIVLMIAWGVVSVVIYRMGSRALKRKPVLGMTEMTDSKGKVVTTLNPSGVIRIRGELWEGKSADGRRINTGSEVAVVGQDGLRLTVCRSKRKRN